MSIQANDVQTLHTYAEGVMKRAEHHASHVRGIALALLGGIIWRAEPGSIEIKERDGKLANVAWWVSISSGKRYASAYNHHTQEIEIRDRTQSGPALHSFTNGTSVADVEAIFRAL